PIQYTAITYLGSLRYALKNSENQIALYTDNGVQLTAFVFNKIFPFKRNYAVVIQDKKKGIIDREGILRITPAFGDIRIGQDGTIQGKPVNEWIILNGENKIQKTVQADSL